jgi:hypothetical protein
MNADAAWAQLLAHPVLRGTLAGHAGTAILEEADDDARTARYRLQGTAATATVTATLRSAGAETAIDLRAEVFGDVPRDELLAAARAVVDAALAAPAPVAPHGGLPAPAKRALAAAGAAALVALALRGRR